jgi:hypothetical protein
MGNLSIDCALDRRSLDPNAGRPLVLIRLIPPDDAYQVILHAGVQAAATRYKEVQQMKFFTANSLLLTKRGTGRLMSVITGLPTEI